MKEEENPRISDTADSKNLAVILTTSLAVAFNILSILVICFVLMPQIHSVAEETAKNRQAVQINHELIKSNWKELEEHRKVVKRLSDLLDMAAARAEKLKKDREKK